MACSSTCLANRGKALEELIVQANNVYRRQGKAVIHKVPTAWVPIRRGSKIVTAKVEEKASVDFLGHVVIPSGSLPVAFDAKTITKGSRWPLVNLEPHQYEYLKDCAQTGAFSFILLGFWQHQKFYILPFAELNKRWQAWKTKTGPASVKPDDSGLKKIRFLDYLDIAQEHLAGERKGETQCSGAHIF